MSRAVLNVRIVVEHDSIKREDLSPLGARELVLHVASTVETSLRAVPLNDTVPRDAAVLVSTSLTVDAVPLAEDARKVNLRDGVGLYPAADVEN